MPARSPASGRSSDPDPPARAPASGARLRLDQLDKTYPARDRHADPVHAVRALSLTVEPGDFFTLLGPSGCGKTTTLRLIAGLDAPDAGSVWLDGRDVTRLKPERRGLGFVFQHYALFPHLSVRDNVAFGLKMRGLGRRARRARAAEALALVELEHTARRRVGELSGGEQQRVALARALAIEPALLLLDEPLSNLDAKLRLETRQRLRDLTRRLDITTVLITHDQEEALTLSDRLGVMRAGAIVQAGTPREVFAEPADAFVARFLGHRNYWPGTAVIEAAGGDEAAEVARVTLAGAGSPVRIHVGGSQPACAGATVEGFVAIRPEDMRLTAPDMAAAARASDAAWTAAAAAPDAASDAAPAVRARVIDAGVDPRVHEVRLALPAAPGVMLTVRLAEREPLPAAGTEVRVGFLREPARFFAEPPAARATPTGCNPWACVRDMLPGRSLATPEPGC